MHNPSFSALNLANTASLDALYQNYQKDRNSINPDLALFFDGLSFAKDIDLTEERRGDSSLLFPLLLQRYIRFAHRLADANPLAEAESFEKVPSFLSDLGALDLESQIELKAPFQGTVKLKDLIERLNALFLGKIGFQFDHIEDPEERLWILSEILNFQKAGYSETVLKELVEAALFEDFLHKNFQGKRRFSIEGADATLPMLHRFAKLCCSNGVSELVLGMAHRGRLNVLANFLKKPYSAIFCEFDDQYHPWSEGLSGDVKYHLGYVNDYVAADGKVHMQLLPNPSHLEAIDPVVQGFARARAQAKGGESKVLPLLIHGDAAFSGQGVVYETLQLSQLEGYRVGGMVHLIINNQVGFTATPEEGRSTEYTTDLGKAFSLPILHVNGESVESALFAAEFAFKWRARFGKSILIDLHCFRKYGHNEGDEPGFTQPLMYAKIKQKSPLFKIYASEQKADSLPIETAFTALLDKQKSDASHFLQMMKTKEKSPVKTAAGTMERLSLEKIRDLASRLLKIPEGFKAHPMIQKMIRDKSSALEKEGENMAIDWGFAELLAYASILDAGTSIRMTGQDVLRGTFSHRHAFYTDMDKGQRYSPLHGMCRANCFFEMYNSPLSEEAVLSFEYGFSLGMSKSLVLWEAQFGDFANGAQVVIDQFIASAASKWGQHSNLVMILPHGQEGQGPEHSSARIERYLSLAADDNLWIVIPSTTGQLFHCLRQSARYSPKRPTIYFSHKSLLRQAESFSTIRSLASGHFEPLIDDPHPSSKVTRLICCSGKFYYALEKKRQEIGALDSAIIRIEQLYPFPEKEFLELIGKYRSVKKVIFAQEEPKNQGMWDYIKKKMAPLLGEKIEFYGVGRPPIAAPAVGYPSLFAKQQKELLEQVFASKGEIDE